MDDYFKTTRYINPMIDVGFKLIFGQEKHKRLIKGLLENVFDLEINELSFTSIEHIGESPEERNAYFDLQCHSEDIGDFIVEVQVKEQKYFADRALFYSTIPIKSQAPKGTWDYHLKPVYFLGLLNFDLPSQSKKEEGWVHHYSLRNDETNGLLTESIRYIFMEVGPFNKKEEECISFQDRFLYYMKNLPTFVHKPDTHGDDYFEELLDAAEYAGLTKEMASWYDERLKNMRDNENVMAFAREKAINEGRAENSREIAAKLLTMGMSVEDIAKVTGLSKEEIDSLK